MRRLNDTDANMDVEESEVVKSDPLLNNNSDSQINSSSEPSLSRSQSIISNPKRHEFLFKVGQMIKIYKNIFK